MKKEELAAALREFYDLPNYMLDADVIYVCRGLFGWYWVRFVHWLKENASALLFAGGCAFVSLEWMIIFYFLYEDLFR